MRAGEPCRRRWQPLATPRGRARRRPRRPNWRRARRGPRAGSRCGNGPRPKCWKKTMKNLSCDALAAVVVPDLDRPDDGRSSATRCRPSGGAVEQQHAGAVVLAGRRTRSAPASSRCLPALPELVAGGVRVGVARLPEPLDEGVALVVLLEREEGGRAPAGVIRSSTSSSHSRYFSGELLDELLLLPRAAPRVSFSAASAAEGRAGAARRSGEASERGRAHSVMRSTVQSRSSIASPFNTPCPDARHAASAPTGRRRRGLQIGPRRRLQIAPVQRPVYLDHNATTPLDPRVREAMLPWLGETHRQPLSAHALRPGGARGGRAGARRRSPRCSAAGRAEIVFTASGTEANNAVIFDARAREPRRPGHLVISALEHPSIREARGAAGEAWAWR